MANEYTWDIYQDILLYFIKCWIMLKKIKYLIENQ
jgi:hypothetical protein